MFMHIISNIIPSRCQKKLRSIMINTHIFQIFNFFHNFPSDFFSLIIIKLQSWNHINNPQIFAASHSPPEHIKHGVQTDAVIGQICLFTAVKTTTASVQCVDHQTLNG